MHRRRSPARWLAPLAIVACAVAVYRVVDDGLRPDEPASSRPATSVASGNADSRTISERRSRARGAKRRRTYTVKAGDTLSSIAATTGVSLARLQKLNPKLDSRSLQTGQRVKLSP